jgi:Beta-glucanase/Beta-glucan synthetase
MGSRRWRVVAWTAVVVLFVAAAYVLVLRPVLRHAFGPPTATGPPTTGPSPTSPESAATDAAAPSGVPMPVGNLPGWRQAFTDDFTGTTLSRAWITYEGEPAADPGGYFKPSHVEVSGGLLTIGAWREPEHHNLYVTGGISNRHTFASAYGRYDIRFRMDRGTGIAYALLLWPLDNRYPPEIDIAEDNGRDRSILYSAVHPAAGGRTILNEVPGDFTDWHTVSLEWTPGSLVFTLDGEPWATVTGEAVPSEPMALALQSQAWYCGHTWEACPDETTPPVVNLQIDWVVAYLPE